jgi:hypothetical protein
MPEMKVKKVGSRELNYLLPYKEIQQSMLYQSARKALKAMFCTSYPVFKDHLITVPTYRTTHIMASFFSCEERLWRWRDGRWKLGFQQ